MPCAASVSAATKSSWTPGPGEHAGGGGAVLAGVEVARLGDGARRCLDVGVVEDDDRRLAAELEVHALEVGGRRARRPPCPARTDPVIATICGRLVLDEATTGVAVAAHDVEHARRQELLRQLGQQRRGRRRGVARLEDDGVARRQRRGDLPDHHHQRVVPRRDLADDADRLTPDVGGVVLHVLAGRPCPRAPGRRRRRSGSGRRRRASPPTSSARAACRCPWTPPR